jgi:hypothetical protein
MPPQRAVDLELPLCILRGLREKCPPGAGFHQHKRKLQPGKEEAREELLVELRQSTSKDEGGPMVDGQC